MQNDVATQSQEHGDFNTEYMDIGPSVSQQNLVVPKSSSGKESRGAKVKALESMKPTRSYSSLPSQPEDPKDSNYQLSQDDTLALMKEKFNEILNLGGFTEDKYQLAYILEKDFDDISTRREKQILSTLGAFVASGLWTVAKDKDQARKIFNGLLNQKHMVEKHLSGAAIPDKMLSTIIEAYNGMSLRKDYIHVLTALVDTMTYPEIEQFNAPSANDYPQSEYEEELLSTPSAVTLASSAPSVTARELAENDLATPDEVDLDTEDDEEYVQWNVPSGHPLFDPPVSRRWYDKALHLNMEYGHALKEVITENFRERLSDGLLRRIVDFFCDPTIINQVAYGTFGFVNKEGIEKVMPAIIRTVNEARVVELLISELKHAKALGEVSVVPAESTLFRILSYCPAKQQHALKAINPYHVSK